MSLSPKKAHVAVSILGVKGHSCWCVLYLTNRVVILLPRAWVLTRNRLKFQNNDDENMVSLTRELQRM